MKNITYIFAGNRKHKYLSKSYESKDFYYGLFSFDTEKYNIEIIEMENHKGLLNNLLRFIDKVFQKIFSLPFYLSKLTTFKNLNILKKSNYVVLVNEAVGCSSLLLLIVLKFFHNVKVSVFVMGLYSKNLKFEKLQKIHNLIIKFFVLFVDNMFFLGKGELEKAIKVHGDISKLIYFPFCIDTDFWKRDFQEAKEALSNDIIFVGNDGNRDIEALIEIAKKLTEFNFIFVSEHDLLKVVKLPNVQIFNGSWSNDLLTDNELKALYSSSKLTIIPLHYSSQPSGQSVTLQSMAVGTPVMITKTEGFWDINEFKDSEDIFFVLNNNINSWEEKIKNVLSNKKLMSYVSINAKEKVINNYNLDTFYKKLLQHI